MIFESGRSTGERIGYPLQYSWASLVAQTVKNPPAMRETWAQSLGWEDSPGGGHGNPLQYSCLEKPHGQRSLVGYSPWSAKSQTRQATGHTHTVLRCSFSLPQSLPQNDPCHRNLCLTSFPFHCCCSVLHLVSI